MDFDLPWNFFYLTEEALWVLNEMIDGEKIEMQVKVGDKVITGKYSGTEVKYEGVEYIIVKHSDILAIVE